MTQNKHKNSCRNIPRINYFLFLIVILGVIFCVDEVNAILCYQESTNSSNIVDSNCNLNYSGNYSNFTGNWSIPTIKYYYDGNWDGNLAECQAGIEPCELNITYIKPAYSFGAAWRYTDGTIEPNFTIPNGCWNYNPQFIFLREWKNYQGGQHYIYCLNATQWDIIYNWGSMSGTEEEGIYWSIAFLENNQTYNSVTYETLSESFVINLTYDNNIYNGISATFFYNGSSYPATQSVIGNNVSFIKSINIPGSYVGTNDFYWRIVLANDTGTYYFNTSIKQQTVYKIQFGLCNTTLNITLLNFTTMDENNGTILNSSFKADFFYGLSYLTNNFSYQNISYTKSNYMFCSNLNRTFLISAQMEYDAVGYVSKTYNLLESSINTTQNIDLKLLLSTLATKFYLNIKQGSAFLSGAIININKKFVGTNTYSSIGIRQSDAAGNFIEYLEIDKDYRYFITDSSGTYLGYLDRNANCQAAPCTINLQLQDATADVFSGYNSYFANNILSNLTYDPTTKIVTYIFLDTTGLANYFRLVVTKINLNTTVKTICDSYLYSSAGTITCDMTGNEGDFTANTYISRSPEKTDKYISFLIDVLYSGNRTLSFALMLFNFCIILTLVIAAASMSKGNPSVILFTLGFALLGLKITTLLPYSWTVVTLLCIAIFYIAWRTKS